MAEFPPTILDLLHLQGVGPKTVATFYKELDVRTIEDLERAAKALADLRAKHRAATLDMVASGKVTASQAIARVDAVALMSRLAHHAWRAVAHLERAAAARMELEQ